MQGENDENSSAPLPDHSDETAQDGAREDGPTDENQSAQANEEDISQGGEPGSVAPNGMGFNAGAGMFPNMGWNAGSFNPMSQYMNNGMFNFPMGQSPPCHLCLPFLY